MKLKKYFDNIILQSCWYPIILITIGLVAYVISYPPLGFYWDDWQTVFLYQNYDPQFIRDYFFFDRPFSSWTYEATFPFLPLTPFVWQFFTMFIRAIAIWLLTISFEKIWPDHKLLLKWSGVLLLVFPSFTMQSISIAFNQHFVTFFLFSLSIYLMISGLENKTKWRWVILALSVLFTGIHIFTMEYFIGLEVIRPLILYFLVSKYNPNEIFWKRIKKVFIYYLPFFMIIIGFLYWRIQVYPQQFIINPTLENPNTPVLLKSLLESPIKSSIKLANLILQDSVYLLTQSWLRSLEPTSIRLDAAFNILSWIVGLTISGLFMLWSNKMKGENNDKPKKSSYFPIVLTGFLALLCGGLPIWIMNRQILIGKWSDRFSLAPMLGVVLIIMIFIDWIVRSKKQKNIVLIIIIGLSIAFQMRTTHKYALDWNNQKDFYWQLYWRVPAVKPGTAFFSAIMPSNYSSDFSVGFSLNTLYNIDDDQSTLSHWYFDPGGTGLYFNKLTTDQNIEYKFRNLKYTGNTSSAMAYMFKPASGCLILLDDAYLGNPNMDPNHEALIKLNNNNQIDLALPTNMPNINVFGKEPEHDWCFYFQKADLARQNKNWEEIFTMMKQADQLGLTPRSGVEKMPELEALFYTKDWESFIETSNSIYSMNVYLDEFLCTQWVRLETNSQISFPEDVRSELSSIVDCSQPFKQ